MMPLPGMWPQQTQQWAGDMRANLRSQGRNPAAFGMPQQQSGGAYSAYSPGQAQSQQSPYAAATPYGQQSSSPRPAANQQGGYQAYSPPIDRQQWQNSFSAWAMPKQDLLRWGQSQSQGSAPLQAQQGPSAQDVWSRNAAIVGQINNTAANQQVGTYLGQGAPPQGWGQTSYNPQQMISNANQMVQQGWQNPFQAQWAAPPPAPPQQQDSAAGIRDLLQGYGIPDNVMSQITGMFGGQQGSQPGQAEPIQDPYGASTPQGRLARLQSQIQETRAKSTDRRAPHPTVARRINRVHTAAGVGGGFTPEERQQVNRAKGLVWKDEIAAAYARADTSPLGKAIWQASSKSYNHGTSSRSGRGKIARQNQMSPQQQTEATAQASRPTPRPGDSRLLRAMPTPGLQQGGSMEPGPAPGTQMYRPPINSPAASTAPRAGRRALPRPTGTITTLPPALRDAEYRARAQQQREQIASRESARAAANQLWVNEQRRLGERQEARERRNASANAAGMWIGGRFRPRTD